MAAKMLERMWSNQKKHYQHHKSIHKFWVGDLVLLKKHNAGKMDLRWEPNYRVIRLKSPWSVLVENQISGKTKSVVKPNAATLVTLRPNTPQKTGHYNPVQSVESQGSSITLTTYLM